MCARVALSFKIRRQNGHVITLFTRAYDERSGYIPLPPPWDVSPREVFLARARARETQSVVRTNGSNYNESTETNLSDAY